MPEKEETNGKSKTVGGASTHPHDEESSTADPVDEGETDEIANESEGEGANVQLE